MDKTGFEDDQADSKPAAREDVNDTADDVLNPSNSEDDDSKGCSDDEDPTAKKSPSPSGQKLTSSDALAASGLAAATSRRSQTVVLSSAERSPNDVLCGRGIPFQKYPGNQRMRRIVHQYRLAYGRSKRHEKGKIVQTVIREIKENGARFLHPLDETGEMWVEAEQDYIYEKISHAMRQRPKNSAAQAARRERQSVGGEPCGLSRKAGKANASSTSATLAIARPGHRHLQGDTSAAAFPNTLAGMGLLPFAQQHPATAAVAASSSRQNNANALFNLISSPVQEVVSPRDASGRSLNLNASAELQRLLQGEHLNRLLAHQQRAAINVHPRGLRPDELFLQLQLQNQQRIEAELEATRLRILLEISAGQQSRYSSNLPTAAATTEAATASQAQASTGTPASAAPVEWFAAVKQEVQRRTLLGLPSPPTVPTGLAANQLRSLGFLGTSGVAAPVATVSAQAAAAADREAQMRALNLRLLVGMASAQQQLQHASSLTVSNFSNQGPAATGLATPSPSSSAGTTEPPSAGTATSEEELQLLHLLELARTRDASRR